LYQGWQFKQHFLFFKPFREMPNMAKEVETPVVEQEKPLTPKQILDKLVAGEITQEQAKAELDKREEAAKAKQAAKPKNVEFGWGKKGGAMIRGLRKFPISLYPNEIDVIDEVWEDFKDYVAAGPADPEKPEETEKLVVGEYNDGVFTPAEEPEAEEAEEAEEAA
jgi:hypothetical protein